MNPYKNHCFELAMLVSVHLTEDGFSVYQEFCLHLSTKLVKFTGCRAFNSMNLNTNITT